MEKTSEDSHCEDITFGTDMNKIPSICNHGQANPMSVHTANIHTPIMKEKVREIIIYF